jgi:hypothetical protein
VTEDEQTEKEELGRQLITADAEIGRRQFTSDMLVNLARRNQSMLYRQLDIINQLEDKEQDPDALADLFRLDHLATRVRRNAESLLVLAGEQAPRTWSAPVALRDVVRAAIAETEDLDRVVFAVDDRVSVSGAVVADLTHLLAELTENAVRFSPPETAVTIRARPNRRDEGGQLLTVEDWGVGMLPDDLAEANALLAHPRDIDLAVSQRLGFHVVARLATRHGISVSLGATPGSGITAVVVLPAALFTKAPAPDGLGLPAAGPSTDNARPYVAGRSAGRSVRTERESGWIDAIPAAGGVARPEPPDARATAPFVPAPETAAWVRPAAPFAHPDTGPDGRWRGWWNPETHGAAATASGVDSYAGDVLGGAGYAGSGYAGTEYAGTEYAGTGGHGANGSNGHGAHGPAGYGPATNGHANGHGANGRDTNGHGGDGPAVDGFGLFGPLPVDGSDEPVPYPRPEGHGLAAENADRRDVDGATRDDVPAAPEPDARAVDEHPPAVRYDGQDDRQDADPRALDGQQADGAHPDDVGSISAPAAPHIPVARQERSAFEHQPVSGSAGRPLVRGSGTRAVTPAPRLAPGPSAGLAASGPAPLPQPRPDATTPPVPPTSRGPQPSPTAGGGRGLRRRVPQSHLAPELRHPGGNGLADTAAPVSADAAASALSRYQASRLAAQAVVDVPTDPPDEGERA